MRKKQGFIIGVSLMFLTQFSVPSLSSADDLVELIETEENGEEVQNPESSEGGSETPQEQVNNEQPEETSEQENTNAEEQQPEPIQEETVEQPEPPQETEDESGDDQEDSDDHSEEPQESDDHSDDEEEPPEDAHDEDTDTENESDEADQTNEPEPQSPDTKETEGSDEQVKEDKPAADETTDQEKVTPGKDSTDSVGNDAAVPSEAAEDEVEIIEGEEQKKEEQQSESNETVWEASIETSCIYQTETDSFILKIIVYSENGELDVYMTRPDGSTSKLDRSDYGWSISVKTEGTYRFSVKDGNGNELAAAACQAVKPVREQAEQETDQNPETDAEEKEETEIIEGEEVVKVLSLEGATRKNTSDTPTEQEKDKEKQTDVSSEENTENESSEIETENSEENTEDEQSEIKTESPEEKKANKLLAMYATLKTDRTSGKAPASEDRPVVALGLSSTLTTNPETQNDQSEKQQNLNGNQTQQDEHEEEQTDDPAENEKNLNNGNTDLLGNGKQQNSDENEDPEDEKKLDTDGKENSEDKKQQNGDENENPENGKKLATDTKENPEDGKQLSNENTTDSGDGLIVFKGPMNLSNVLKIQNEKGSNSTENTEGSGNEQEEPELFSVAVSETDENETESDSPVRFTMNFTRQDNDGEKNEETGSGLTPVYYVQIDDEEPVLLEGTEYALVQGGSYTLTFLAKDAEGNLLGTKQFTITEGRIVETENENVTGENPERMLLRTAPLFTAGAGGETPSLLGSNSGGETPSLLGSNPGGETPVLLGSNPGGNAVLNPNSGLENTNGNDPNGLLSGTGTEIIESQDVRYTISVTRAGTVTEGWSTEASVFSLSYTAEPAGEEKVSFAALRGSEQEKVEGTSYTAPDGEYTLHFLLLNEAGEELARSDAFKVKQDTVGPIMMLYITDGYGLVVTGTDTVSGAVSVSVNGGKKWSLLTRQKDGTMRRAYQANGKVTLKPGEIRIRDAAGNITKSTEQIILGTRDESVELETDEDKMNGSVKTTTVKRSGTGTSRSVSHSKSTTTLISAYNGVDLILDSSTMSQLMIGDETLDLTLVPGDGNNGGTASFKAHFAALNESGVVDTLVLTSDEIMEEEYTWVFSGTVSKKLSASGINYMVLQTGENSVTMPTGGFSGGTRYAMYRSSGMVSKDFVYAVTMDTADTAFRVNVTVGDETYTMTDNRESEFYYYDVRNNTLQEMSQLSEGGQS